MAEERWIPGNHTVGRAGRDVDTLFIHTIEGSLRAADSWFRNPAARASTHEGIGDAGERWLWVRPKDTAWGAGNTIRNQRSYQFENEGYAAKRDWTTAQLDALAEGIVYALNSFPKTPKVWARGLSSVGIKGHMDVDPVRRSDPGYVDLAYLTWKSGKLGAQVIWPTTLTVRNGDPEAMVTAFVQGVVGAGIDGVFGPVTATKVKSWQAQHGLSADGIFGRKSWEAHYAQAVKKFETVVTPPAPTPTPQPPTDLQLQVAKLAADLEAAFKQIRDLQATKSGIGHHHGAASLDVKATTTLS